MDLISFFFFAILIFHLTITSSEAFPDIPISRATQSPPRHPILISWVTFITVIFFINLPIYCLPLSLPAIEYKFHQSRSLCTAIFPAPKSLPGPKQALRVNHLQKEGWWGERVGKEKWRRGQAGRGFDFPTEEQSWGLHLGLYSPAQTPPPHTLGTALGQCPGSEVGRLTFLVWIQKQMYPELRLQRWTAH